MERECKNMNEEQFRNNKNKILMFDHRTCRYRVMEYTIKDIQFEGNNEYFINEEGRRCYFKFYPPYPDMVPIRNVIE